MVKSKLKATNYKTSFLVPDFVEIQRRSFSRFLEKGIVEEFSKINPIRSDVSKLKLTLYVNKYLLVLPDYNVTEAVLQGKTYSGKLYLPAMLSIGGKPLSIPQHEKEKPSNLSPLVQRRENKGTASILNMSPLLQPSIAYLPNNADELALASARAATTAPTGAKDVYSFTSQTAENIYPLTGQGERDCLATNRQLLSTNHFPTGRKGTQLTRAASAPHPFCNPDYATQGIVWVLVGNVPLMTKRGHFIVNGSPRVVVNQLIRSPGVYFHERIWGVGRKKKRVVYADFVSRRGAWLRIQAYKEGDTWARLKKTPKVPFPLFYDAMTACEKSANNWTKTDQEALLELHEEVNPTRKDISVENGCQFLMQRFKNPRTYDLGAVGRSRLNKLFGISIPTHQLTSQDLYSAFEQIQVLQNDQMLPDDIDHLKNRRVRASGELVQGQFEIGVYRLEKAILGKMRKPPKEISAQTLLNTKPLNGALREFFGSSPLSQYMDQTNPLAEITQKRRISSLGPGGISRETAGMAVRGIHPTHYGRICPIETPEGKNAGLVNSLTVYTRIGDNGILETPYYRVLHGQVQSREGFEYFSAEEEEERGVRVAPGDLKSSTCQLLPKRPFPVREIGDPQEDFKYVDRVGVGYIAISPIQMISIATSLIPFLEHDDANRALMGSNMQRQAVPLLQSERPVVGTGLEASVIAESGHALQAKASGYVSSVGGGIISIYSSQSPNPTNTIDASAAARAVLHSQRALATLQGTTLFEKWSGSFSELLRRRSWRNDLGFKPHSLSGGVKNQSHRLNIDKCIRALNGRSLFLVAMRRRQLQDSAEGSSVTFMQGLVGNPGMSTSKVNSSWSSQGWLHQQWHKNPRDTNGKTMPTNTGPSLIQRAEYEPRCAEVEIRNNLASRGAAGDGNSQCASLVTNNRASVEAVTDLPTPSLCSLDYALQSYHRSNQETCLTQIPVVCEGDWVQKGDLVADCSASRFGELALGKNILIAYLPWEGYNFEDAVVISERLVCDDVYTSVHIQKYEIEIRETRFGFEKITSQIPGVSDNQKHHLNWQGVAIAGSWVKEGDVLVGKVSPRSSHPLSPYERLAYDIANVEAATTEDTSLRVPKGVEGRVVNCQVFKAPNVPLDQQTSTPGRVRIYLAEKRKIQVGDKVAGRHGNKGIVSRILPRQDMPYLPNGSVVDMVLNPLGIPSRMNVGQVFECLLGLAGLQLGQHFKITPFDEIYGAEASRSLVYLKLYQARLRTTQDWLFNLSFPGKSALFDGRTGVPFDQWVTIGQAYMLKLVHLVDEKIHARSTGPYSLVTKQPLGGRSKHGGQRLGEMEVWALEGFGAAYTLQEMLTSKSDDIVGREQVVEAILFKGRMSLGNPEAFKVLVRELQSLCLDVGVYAISPDRLRREVVDVGGIP